MTDRDTTKIVRRIIIDGENRTKKTIYRKEILHRENRRRSERRADMVNEFDSQI